MRSHTKKLILCVRPREKLVSVFTHKEAYTVWPSQREVSSIASFEMLCYWASVDGGTTSAWCVCKLHEPRP